MVILNAKCSHIKCKHKHHELLAFGSSYLFSTDIYKFNIMKIEINKKNT